MTDLSSLLNNRREFSKKRELIIGLLTDMQKLERFNLIADILTTFEREVISRAQPKKTTDEDAKMES